MNVTFKPNFLKDVKSIRDKSVLQKITESIELLESISTTIEIRHLKKLEGGRNFYRIRVGDYRIGLIIQNNEITLFRCLHRKEIYKYFP